MAITLTEKEYEKPPVGTHTAICFLIADLGTQPVKFNNETKYVHKVWMEWELCEEKTLDDNVFTIGNAYTLSLSPKAILTKDLTSWNGEAPKSGFALNGQLGKACNLTVVHNQSGDRIYANIGALAPLKKNEKAPKPINPLIVFELGDDFQEEIYNNLPKWLREKIAKSPEYMEIVNPAKSYSDSDMPNDDVPFPA